MILSSVCVSGGVYVCVCLQGPVHHLPGRGHHEAGGGRPQVGPVQVQL